MAVEEVEDGWINLGACLRHSFRLVRNDLYVSGRRSRGKPGKICRRGWHSEKEVLECRVCKTKQCAFCSFVTN